MTTVVLSTPKANGGTNGSSTSAQSHKDLALKAWEKFAPVYERHMRETGHFRAMRKLLRRAMGRILPQINGSVLKALDVSCGSGEMLHFIRSMALSRQRIERAILAANDISPAMRAEANKRLSWSDVTYLQDDATALRSLPTDFDIVLCTNTMHWVTGEDRSVIIAEIARVVARGGFALFMEEWEPKATPSRYMSDELSRLLKQIERPIPISELFEQIKIRDLGLSYTSREAIDPNHDMFLGLYRKTG